MCLGWIWRTDSAKIDGMGLRGKSLFLSLVVALLGAASCSPSQSSPAPQSSCAPTSLSVTASSTGPALIFQPDPMIDSGNANLTPTSSQLDQYRKSVTLSHLSGEGVLQGQYANVLNGLQCNMAHNAYDPGNQFAYSHSDPRFQEAMAYYYGDQFRASLDGLGYLQPAGSIDIIAHCMQDDNAFFERIVQADGTTVQHVCLGDSVATPGASYADDGIVTAHESEHATTMDTYSPIQDLNQFWYDEAGSMNEAISDFMGLLFTDQWVPSSFDPRLFSRWALGTFVPNDVNTRGAHLCPAYDSAYPDCGNYPNFSADKNTISYVYPDGVGWPYANNYAAPGYASQAFKTYSAQEEIHNAGTLLEGALWDVYTALQSNHGGSADAARAAAIPLVLEAVKQLPHPSSANLSPVTFIGFAANVVQAAKTLGYSTTDQNSVAAALEARGLYNTPQLSAGWAAVGPGVSYSPGVKILDNPNTLKNWLGSMGGDPTIVTQGLTTGLNGKLDPGEVDAIWFDIQDTASLTAGGVLVTVTSNDPNVTFLDGNTNIGAVSSSQAQIFYGKINGTTIVNALSSSNATYHVPASNSYFGTDPLLSGTWRAALWISVSPNAKAGEVATFQIQAEPSNGAAATVNFPVTIN